MITTEKSIRKINIRKDLGFEFERMGLKLKSECSRMGLLLGMDDSVCILEL